MRRIFLKNSFHKATITCNYYKQDSERFGPRDHNTAAVSTIAKKFGIVFVFQINL
jgi:hypothetical protein